jgi:hypothetical protein
MEKLIEVEETKNIANIIDTVYKKGYKDAKPLYFIFGAVSAGVSLLVLNIFENEKKFSVEAEVRNNNQAVRTVVFETTNANITTGDNLKILDVKEIKNFYDKSAFTQDDKTTKK